MAGYIHSMWTGKHAVKWCLAITTTFFLYWRRLRFAVLELLVWAKIDSRIINRASVVVTINLGHRIIICSNICFFAGVPTNTNSLVRFGLALTQISNQSPPLTTIPSKSVYRTISSYKYIKAKVVLQAELTLSYNSNIQILMAEITTKHIF